MNEWMNEHLKHRLYYIVRIFLLNLPSLDDNNSENLFLFFNKETRGCGSIYYFFYFDWIFLSTVDKSFDLFVSYSTIFYTFMEGF